MRGRTARHRDIRDELPPASMRPPQNAGENVSYSYRPESQRDCFNEAPAKCGGEHDVGRGVGGDVLASMRPPQNAGENVGHQRRGYGRCSASMRPPQNAGENETLWRGEFDTEAASMRPPQNAGENVTLGPESNAVLPRFNEAPAKCGGERRSADARRPDNNRLQ